MAISIDWATGVISIPQADLTFESGTLYSLDTNAFWEELKLLEASEFGMPFPDTQIRTAAVTIAGVTYAPGLQIVAPYTVTFEDGQYAVRLDGTNNNIFEEGIINRNQVSIIPTNSAGLQIVTSGSGLSPGEQAQLTIVERILRNKMITDPVSGKLDIYADDGLSVLFSIDLFEDAAGTQAYQGSGAERRERIE